MARGRPDQPSERRQREAAESRQRNSNINIPIPLPSLTSTPERRPDQSSTLTNNDDSITETGQAPSTANLEAQLKQFYERQDAFMKRLEEKVESRERRASKKLSKDLTCAVRLAYSLLKDENGQDLKWNLQKRYSEDENKRVNEALIANIRSTDSITSLVDISAAMKVHFRTKKRQQKLMDNNKKGTVLKDQRRRSRLNSKRSSRASVLSKTSKYTEEERKKYLEYLKDTSYISSEESVTEAEHSDSSGSDSDAAEAPPRKKVLVVKTLTWRSQELSRVFQYLDKKGKRGKSSRSLSMAIERRNGPPSTRPKPVEDEDDV